MKLLIYVDIADPRRVKKVPCPAYVTPRASVTKDGRDYALAGWIGEDGRNHHIQRSAKR